MNTFNPAVRYGRKAGRVRSGATGMVYFITCLQPDFPIKIGFATNLTPRIASIQTSLPFTVKLLYATPGTRTIEREIGDRFSEHRVRGEWFRPVKPIFEYIDDLKKLAAQAQRETEAATVPKISAPEVPILTQLRLGII